MFWLYLNIFVNLFHNQHALLWKVHIIFKIKHAKENIFQIKQEIGLQQ